MVRVVNDWEVDDKGNAYRYYDPYPDQVRWEQSEARRLGQRLPLEGMYWRQYQHLYRRWYSVKINFAKLYRRG